MRNCQSCKDNFEPKSTFQPTCLKDECKKFYYENKKKKAAAKKIAIKKSPKPKAKKKTKAQQIGALTDKAAKLLQRLVRLKAADEEGYASCVTCGVTKHWTELQGGHFIGRGNAATKIMEENVHPQCAGCNGFGMKHGDAEKIYTIWMIDFYGRDFVNEIIATKGKKYKWFRPDIEDAIEDFTQQLRDLGCDKT